MEHSPKFQVLSYSVYSGKLGGAGRDGSVGIATCHGLYGPGIESQPIPVAERSKARVCGRSLAGVAGSYPAGGMDVCVLCVVKD